MQVSVFVVAAFCAALCAAKVGNRCESFTHVVGEGGIIRHPSDSNGPILMMDKEGNASVITYGRGEECTWAIESPGAKIINLRLMQAYMEGNGTFLGTFGHNSESFNSGWQYSYTSSSSSTWTYSSSSCEAGTNFYAETAVLYWKTEEWAELSIGFSVSWLTDASTLYDQQYYDSRWESDSEYREPRTDALDSVLDSRVQWYDAPIYWCLTNTTHIDNGGGYNLVFTGTFDLEASPVDTGIMPCQYDSLMLFSNSLYGDMRRMGQLCGNTIPPVTSYDPDSFMAVVITTNDDVRSGGITFHWEEVAQTQCSPMTEVTGSSDGQIFGGFIGSPMWRRPSAPGYADNLTCAWHVSVPALYPMIQVNLDSYLNTADCGDRVHLYDGADATAVNNALFCGSNASATGVTFLTSGSEFYVEFESDGSGASNGEGFRLSWAGVGGHCSGVHTFAPAMDGVFAEPTMMRGNADMPNEYETLYEDNADCGWLMQAAPGYQSVLVSLQWFAVDTGYADSNSDLTGASDCARDNVTLYDGMDANAPVIGVICGYSSMNAGSATFASTCPSMFFRFMTDSTGTDRGFQVKWTSIGPLVPPTTTTGDASTTGDATTGADGLVGAIKSETDVGLAVGLAVGIPVAVAIIVAAIFLAWCCICRPKKEETGAKRDTKPKKVSVSMESSAEAAENSASASASASASN